MQPLIHQSQVSGGIIHLRVKVRTSHLIKAKAKEKARARASPRIRAAHVTFAPRKGGGKGKGKFPFKGSRSGPITPPHTLSSPQRPTDNSSTQNTASLTGASSQPIRCHFCHKIGHYKNNCRQYLALRNHPGYGNRLQQPQSMQLIYDHLEDSVFAPKSCQYTSFCTNPPCDGSECYTSFVYSDFEQAETYFNNNILSLVENVKLDRPADSLPPLTRSSYVAQQAR